MSKFLALDFETSGLSNQYDQILQVGAAVMDLGGNVLETYTTRITPFAKFSIKLDALSAQVGEITPESLADWYRKVSDAPTSIEAFVDFMAWVQKHEAGRLPVVAWNAGFDRAFWSQWRFQNSKRVTGPGLSPTWVCAMETAMDHPATKGMPSYSLDSVLRYIGMDARPAAHDALGDAILAGTVYARLCSLEGEK